MTILDLSGSAHMGEKSISFLAHVTWTAESWLNLPSKAQSGQAYEMDQQRLQHDMMSSSELYKLYHVNASLQS